MAILTKRFTLGDAYQDISEGNAICSFRLRYRPQPGGGVRICLTRDEAPDPGTSNFDSFLPPGPGHEWEPSNASFTGLGDSDRVYARAMDAGDSVTLVVYRK